MSYMTAEVRTDEENLTTSRGTPGLHHGRVHRHYLFQLQFHQQNLIRWRAEEAERKTKLLRLREAEEEAAQKEREKETKKTQKKGGKSPPRNRKPAAEEAAIPMPSRKIR